MSNTSTHSFKYSAFEAYFRGSRKEVKERLSVYLESVKLVTNNASPSALDIGCGRGEWLELLRENNINAEGIDCNQEFVNSCKKNGLNVHEADLFAFLEEEVTTRYTLITGFHIIEHIPKEKQLWFLDRVFCRLAPGGMAILETPNPENVTVGSCNFYIDPTHLRPVPPMLLHFLALQIGFSMPMIVRLNRDTVGTPLRYMANENADAALYNQLLDIVASRLLQAPDYALIVFAPPSPSSEMLNSLAAINELNDAFILPPEIISEQETQERTRQELTVQKETALLKKHVNDLYSSGNKRDTDEDDIPLDEYPESVRNIFHQLHWAHRNAEKK
jgi:O-antigen chain-terminating methyltransferase